jgi:hypothetical protein
MKVMPMKDKPDSAPDPQGSAVADGKDSRILGLSTADLAGVSVEELVGNKTAVTMIMHYYKQLSDENVALRNDLNTLKSYADGYNEKRTTSAVGAVLLAASNVGVGFGVNLLTNGSTWPGLATLLPGLGLVATGLYLSLRKPR